MKYADDLVLLAKKGMALQGTTDTPAEVERCYGMDMKVADTKVTSISKYPSLIQIMIDQKQGQNVE